jgi:hypothetical protein
VSRGVRRLLAGSLAAALLLGGCGIPDSTPVERVGAGPSTGTSIGEVITPQDRSGREATSDPAAFVRNYLEAAAGAPKDALEQVKEFLNPLDAATFKPTTARRVIHLVESPLVNPGSDKVTLVAETVGTLGDNGILSPVSDGAEIEYELTVSAISGKTGLFVTKPPQVLLLSDTALNKFYERRTLYFWNLEHTGLVPDMRYLSRETPPEQRPNEIIKWLVDGPADWLEGAVERLPEDTQVVGNVPAPSNDKLQVNLTGQAVQPPDDPAALDRLRRQLMWSLRPDLPGTLALKVGSQEQSDYAGTDYLTSNPAYALQPAPERFLIYNGQVRRMSNYPNATESLPVLRPEANREVKAAAFAGAGSRRFAALVVAAGGRSELRVGAAQAGEQADLARIGLPGGSTGQPVWAITSADPHTPGIGLIAVGGKLYSFASDGSAVSAVDGPAPSGGITAVAVAPDGRRLALVAAGKLYVGALSTGGDGLQLLLPRPILTPELREVSAADWSSETGLTIAGTRVDRNRVSIVDVRIDGTQDVTTRLDDIGTAVVSYLAAYPVGPTSGARYSANVAYVANGAAFDVPAGGPVRITVGDLADPVPDPPAGIVPTAPFFLR